MRKREKFLISAFILSLGLLGTQYVPLDYRLLATTLLFFIAYAVSSWALYEDLHGIEWFVLVPFPALYAVSVSLFYFLLPVNILSKALVLGLFGVGMYAIYLTANIYSVAKFRTIQLLRAAHAVGLFMKLIMMFLFANTVFSLNMPFWANGLALAFWTFPLAYLSLWSIELQEKIDKKTLYEAIGVSIMVGETAMAISFFPSTLWTASLYIVGVVYASLGILTNKLSGRLFQNMMWEYVSVWVAITVVFFAMLSWR